MPLTYMTTYVTPTNLTEQDVTPANVMVAHRTICSHSKKVDYKKKSKKSSFDEKEFA